MPNYWISVPLADYEGHMSDANVDQLQPLAELFAEALGGYEPASIAILGIAGGNGLEHVPSRVARIVGVDINADYISVVRERYANLSTLELHCLDLAHPTATSSVEAVVWVHAALLFEHAGMDVCLKSALSLVQATGTLSVVLQLPATGSTDVASTGFTSMQLLKDEFALIDPNEFTARVSQAGFKLQRESRRALPGGKAFWLGVFRR
ncbi:MAG: methyltransferase domain-containing protein [Acidobacteriota bacterium]